MSATDKKPKKKIMPKAGKRRAFKAALDATMKQYPGTLGKLAK